MGILYIVATPIGNMEDITIRAIKTLFRVNYIACEDTRKTGNLINNLESGIRSQELEIRCIDFNNKPKLISYYDEVENLKTPEIINLLKENNDVALVSDSGTPLIADPGYKLISECIKRGIKVESVPGPSSVVSSLVSSGLPTNQFLFLGYLPHKSTKRRELLNSIYRLFDLPRRQAGKSLKPHPSIIFFETTHRIKESLHDLRDIFGDIEIVITRELTKIHEEIWRGKIAEALKKEFKGELVILFFLNLRGV